MVLLGMGGAEEEEEERRGMYVYACVRLCDA